ncbi:effector-associated constant component EACC1 [[Kitasatospora] papulosa]|uniref:effector-associated constant component EACC1 n=1 Tax=[Kitasatospora] papulosa TaxID=1464011 RepID=UPI00367F5664
MTEVELRIVSEAGAKVPDGLRTFLSRDNELRGVGRARWTSEAPKVGTLGDALDVLTLVVASTLALPSAIEAVARWCGSRGTTEGVEIRLGSQRITVTGTDDPAEIRRMADLLKTAYPESTPGTGSGEPTL